MILAIDIGNTSIHVGLFERGRLRRRFGVPTAMARTPNRLRRRLPRAEQAIICSVVPRATAGVVRALRAAGTPRIRVIGRHLKVPLKNRYRYPGQVGQDRLVGAYAAWKEFGGRGVGGGGRDCIVVDLGTAITIDVVTRKGEYLGGVIAPGIDISLEALATRTALLPRVTLRPPPEPLGRDTASSIRSGLLYGCAALCDGLVERLMVRYAPKAVVVATGGSCRLVSRHTRTLERLRPNLVLDGLHNLTLK
jgi:type III pantothenate kinase